MKPTDFLNFQTFSKKFAYKKIHYTKVNFIHANSSMYVGYKTSFKGTLSTVRLDGTTRNQRTKPRDTLLDNFNNVKQITEMPLLESKKKADIKSMLKYMPQVDKQFFGHFVL